MHPAISVIFFTVSSGAGFGFMALLGLGATNPPDVLTVFLLAFAAAGFAAAGLLASTFHLGHPERAWRALSQWRSSWLSREGVAAVVTLCLFAIYILIWMLDGQRLAWLGGLVTVGSVLTVYTTSMIYAQLRTVPHWHCGLTTVCYLLFSLCTGVLLAAAVGGSGEILGVESSLLTLVILIIAWAAKLAWWKRASTASLGNSGSTVETATGLGFIGKTRLFEKPHSGENYLSREMVHKIGRKHAEKLRRIALISGFLIPALLCLVPILTGAQGYWLMIAFVMTMAGLSVERWLFFAEAQHSVSLYYQQ